MSTYYVDAINGSDYNDGLSPETAWATITKACNTMVSGDVVYVAPGVYRESIYFVNAPGTFTVIGDPYCSIFTNSKPGFVRFTDTDETGYRMDSFRIGAADTTTFYLRNLFIDGLYLQSWRTFNLYNCTYMYFRGSYGGNNTIRFYDSFVVGTELASGASAYFYRCVVFHGGIGSCLGNPYVYDSIFIVLSQGSSIYGSNRFERSLIHAVGVFTVYGHYVNFVDSIFTRGSVLYCKFTRCVRFSLGTPESEVDPVTPWSLGWTNPRAFLRGIAKALPFAQGYADFLDSAEEDLFGIDAVPSPFGTSLTPKSDAFPMEVGKTSLVDDQGKTRCIRIESMSVWHSRYVVSGQTTVSAEIWFNEVTDQDYKPVLGVINMSTGERYETVATDIPEKWQTLGVTFDAYQVSDIMVYIRSRYASETHYVLVSTVLIE